MSLVRSMEPPAAWKSHSECSTLTSAWKRMIDDVK